MKNLFFVGLFIVLFVSCVNQERYTQNSPEIETVKSIIKDYDSKNYDNLISHFADTASIAINNIKPFNASKLPEYHGQSDGLYSSRAFLTDDLEFEMVVTDDGKTWVNFWGTWKGTLASSGKDYTIPIHLTYQFIDGKVVKQFAYWDATEITLAIQNSGENKNIVANAYALFAKGDVPAFLALLDEKVEWNEAESFIYHRKKPYIGADEAVKGVFSKLGSEWEYWNIVDLQLYEFKNGMVLATGRYQAKNKANGKILDAQMAHVWTLSNNKIVKFQQYTDTKQAFEAYQ